MPKYTINGKTYRSATPLSDDDLEELASGQGATPSTPQQPLESQSRGLLDTVKDKAPDVLQAALTPLTVVNPLLGATSSLIKDPRGTVETAARSLPLAGGVAGSAVSPVVGTALGATGGTALKDIVLSALGTPDAPQTAGETLGNQAATGLSTLVTGGLLKGAGSAVGKGTNLVRALRTEAPEVAKARTLELLGKKGLKDTKPTIFDKNEREAAVNYAETVAKNAKNLTSQQLQEARSTLKDVLDNNIVNPSSPTGQIVSRAKDTVSKQFRELNPDISAAFDATDKAVKAKAIRDALKSAAKKLPVIGAVGAAGAKAYDVLRNL